MSEHSATKTYGSTRLHAFPRPCEARIAKVDDESPARRAGIEAGMVVTHANGVPLRDIIEWQWQSDSETVELALDTGETVSLERGYGESWGITFDDSIFDGVITCRNRCTFCFMNMLPKGMRSSLYMRDDDYRLSFLQGNFVTLTNVDDDELERIISYRLSPLHVSLHAVSDDVREQLMGVNARRGMDNLEMLLDAGIDVHVQVVLVPGVNDGSELSKTLAWIETRPNVLSAGFVPLGYTKHQTRFESSYSDDPDAAAEVIEQIREFQEDSGVERRNPRLQVSDELYLNAGFDFPPAYAYTDYPQFHDGIGMMRAFIDEWGEATPLVEEASRRLASKDPVAIVTGTAFAHVLKRLIEGSPLSGKLVVLPVKNDYFGGNVDVTCLLTGKDVISALQGDRASNSVLLPREMLNPSGKTLDDVSVREIEVACNVDIGLCTYSPEGILRACML